MIKVLFLSQWYPNRYDAMAGLFVQKHAEAVGLFAEVCVLYIHPNETIRTFEIEEKKHNNISETIIYFPHPKKGNFYKFIKIFNYLRAYIIGFKIITSKGFKPDILHVNILTRTGLIAFLYKLWKGTPYLITEHWSRYLPGRNNYKGFIRKVFTRIIVKNAAAILTVSDNLKKAMINHKLLNSHYYVVNNVVDNNFFSENTTVQRLKKRIIHISCFDEKAKNISGIFRAILELSKKRNDFEFIIIGTGIDFDKIVAYAQTLDIDRKIVHFLGEKTPEEVANWLKNSDFLVLFSNYETAGIVISESLVLGKPVLSTKVGGAPEYINEQNGILINVGDEIALLEKMDYLLDHYQNYDSEKIKNEAMYKFSYHSVGKLIVDIYSNSIKCI
jgi:glycosyltransferase involved in cell wall biosynthesis